MPTLCTFFFYYFLLIRGNLATHNSRVGKLRFFTSAGDAFVFAVKLFSGMFARAFCKDRS